MENGPALSVVGDQWSVGKGGRFGSRWRFFILWVTLLLTLGCVSKGARDQDIGEGDLEIRLELPRREVGIQEPVGAALTITNISSMGIRLNRHRLFFFAFDFDYIDPVFDFGQSYTYYPDRGPEKYIKIGPGEVITRHLTYVAPNFPGPWDVILRYAHFEKFGEKAVFFESNKVAIEVEGE